jgi:hypothetical protein
MWRIGAKGHVRGTLPSHDAENEDNDGAGAHGERKQRIAPSGRRKQHHLSAEPQLYSIKPGERREGRPARGTEACREAAPEAESGAQHF